MRSMVIPELQPCHPPVPLSCPHNGSPLSLSENCWPSRVRGIGYTASIAGAGEKVAYVRPGAVYQCRNHRDFFDDVEKGNYHTFFHLGHLPLCGYWPVTRNCIPGRHFFYWCHVFSPPCIDLITLLSHC